MPHLGRVAILLLVPLASRLGAQQSSPPPDWLVADTAAKAANLNLVVTAPPGAPSALINGYRDGAI